MADMFDVCLALSLREESGYVDEAASPRLSIGKSCVYSRIL